MNEVIEDLSEALRELLEASEVLANGNTPIKAECDRYDDAVTRAKRVLARANREP